jgi:hypothetical protein
MSWGVSITLEHASRVGVLRFDIAAIVFRKLAGVSR